MPMRIQTQFGEWLKSRGDAPYRWAKRRGITKSRAYFLAGSAVLPVYRSMTHEFLRGVAEETGIPIETLAAEALWAAEEHDQRGVENGDLTGEKAGDPVAGGARLPAGDA